MNPGPSLRLSAHPLQMGRWGGPTGPQVGEGNLGCMGTDSALGGRRHLKASVGDPLGARPRPRRSPRRSPWWLIRGQAVILLPPGSDPLPLHLLAAPNAQGNLPHGGPAGHGVCGSTVGDRGQVALGQYHR